MKLHKIASNSEEVMQQLSTADLAKSMEQLDLDRDDLPIHHSLGLSWDLATDTFIYVQSLRGAEALHQERIAVDCKWFI